MKRSKLYVVATLLVATLIFIGCQLEDEVQHNPHEKVDSGNSIRTLNGEDAKQVRNKLMSLLKEKGTIHVLEESNEFARTDGGTIDFNSILEVMDTLGVKNYTFRVINHPQDDYKTFHNLILTEKQGVFEATMMEYKMTEQFAAAYNSQLKSFQEFAGRVGASSITPIADPCQEIIVEIPDPISQTPGDPAGGSADPGEPSYGSPGSDPGAGGGMSSGCVDIVVSVECSCGRSYSSWDNYTSSVCGNGSYPGFTVTVVISYQYNMLCRAEDDPCNPEGLIGVLEPFKDCGAFETIIEKVINTEGGYVNDLQDHGGETNKGVTYSTFKRLALTVLGIENNHENFMNLTVEQAKTIYKKGYWDVIKCDEIIDNDLRYLLFDFYVNSGKSAIKLLKSTLSNLGYQTPNNDTLDTQTLDIINNPVLTISLYNNYKLARKQYYDNIVNTSVNRYLQNHPNASPSQIRQNTQKKFENGWNARVNSFKNKTSTNSSNVNC